MTQSNPTECYPYSLERHDSKGSRPLDEVYHICHLKEALQILRDGRIRSRPIANGRLKESNIRVCYLSANDYGANVGSGSAYGYVRFCFDWSRVIAGRRLYWIEGFTQKSYRILVTDKRHARLRRLNLKRDSPVIYAKSHRWYWDCRTGSQFLVEADLSLRNCLRVDFVTHDTERCARDPRCDPPADSPYSEGAKLLAALFSDKDSDRFKRSRLLKKRNSLHESALKAWNRLLQSLSRAHFKGRLLAKDKASRHTTRQALREFAANRPKMARKLCGQFRNAEELRRALNALAVRRLKIDGLTNE